MSTSTRFQKEVKGNSEMGNYNNIDEVFDANLITLITQDYKVKYDASRFKQSKNENQRSTAKLSTQSMHTFALEELRLG